MTDEICHVAGCGREVHDAYVCQRCTEQLAHDLRAIITGRTGDTVLRALRAGGAERYVQFPPERRRVRTGSSAGAPIEVDEIRPGDFARRPSSPFDHNGGLLADLLASYARETRTGRGGRAAETPLVWHEKAGELRKQLAATLVRHAITTARGRDVTLPEDPAPLLVATWLERHLSWLRQQSAGAAAVVEIHRAVKALQRIIDPVDDRQFIGLCTAQPLDAGACTCRCHAKPTLLDRALCDGPLCAQLHRGAVCAESLYAATGDPLMTCRTCHQLYDVDEYRRHLLAALGEISATATEISVALTSLDQPVTPARIRKWKERGRLTVRGHKPRGDGRFDPLYRIDDVKALLADDTARRARKAG